LTLKQQFVLKSHPLYSYLVCAITIRALREEIMVGSKEIFTK